MPRVRSGASNTVFRDQRSSRTDEHHESGSIFNTSRIDLEMGSAAASEEGRERDNVDFYASAKNCESVDFQSKQPESTPPPRWGPSIPFKHLPDVKGDSWEEVMNTIDKYDKGLCEGWNKDVDSTLVFAGLFSATVTAFTVESYKWLAEDPADTTVRLLAQLSQHLGTMNVTVNETPFMVATAAIRINTFWFLSLIIALSAALIGILCKQWIREYQGDAPISNQEAFELRQLRRRSWEQWRVPDIISSTSLLLQLALLLFFAGVVDLLWSRVHVKVVAIVIVVAVGLSVLFLLVTIVLPSYYDLFRVSLRGTCGGDVGWVDLIPCAYRSPLSRVLLSITRSMIHPIWHLRGRWSLEQDGKRSDWLSVDLHLLRHSKMMPGLGYSDPKSQESDYLHRGMKWAVNTFGDNAVMLKHLFQCMESLPLVVNTLVPYALDYTPSDSFPRNQPRASAYAVFISRARGLVDQDLKYFFIEVSLQLVRAILPFIDSEASSNFPNLSPELITLESAVNQLVLSDLPQDLYLTLILVSHRLAGGSFRCRDILAQWLPFLVLSWVHDDETIRNEGARWASVVAANTSATIDICPNILDSFSTIISGRWQSTQLPLWTDGSDKFSEEVRRRIISSEPFRVLFSWAGSHAQDPRISEHLAWYNHDTMMEQALHFAHLPANHFCVCADGRTDTTESPNDHRLPSVPTHSTPIRGHRTIEAGRPLVAAHVENIPAHDGPLTRMTSNQSISTSSGISSTHDPVNEPGPKNSPIGESVTWDDGPRSGKSQRVVPLVNRAIDLDEVGGVA